MEWVHLQHTGIFYFRNEKRTVQGLKLLKESLTEAEPERPKGDVSCRMALDKAVADGHILKIPAAICKAPATYPGEVSALTGEEIERLLIQAKEDGCYEVLLLELSPGLRRGEILALRQCKKAR